MDMIEAIEAHFDGSRYYIEFENINDLDKFESKIILTVELFYTINNLRKYINLNGFGVLFFDDYLQDTGWGEYSPRQNPNGFLRVTKYKDLTNVVKPYLIQKISIDSWEELMK